MFTRSVCNLLVASIIACPFGCNVVLCAQCCWSKQSMQSVRPVIGTEDCCCQRTKNDTDDQRPCDDAGGKSECQGVCGGAVIEKPIGFLTSIEAQFVSRIHDASSSTIAAILAECRLHAAECRFACRSTPGRYIRTLHMSLLC